MQSDEVVWQIINHGHCSFKAKTDSQNFCRNEHNVTGLCNRSSCPLANSRYATIREHDGKVYLYIKTVERAHTPAKLWQKIRLSRNYTKALGQVNDHLVHWPKFLVHKNKQRLTKITQYLIRMRKLALKPRKAIITEPARLKKREARREVKAEKAADLSNSIEKELLARLKSGTYGDIYNFPMTQYNRVLDGTSVPDGVEEVEKAEGAEEVESELDDESEEEMDYVEDLDESEDDMEDLATNWGHGEDNSSDEGGSDEDGSGEDGSSSDGGEDGDDSEDDGKRGRASTSKRPRAAAAGKRPRREIESNIEHEPAQRQRQ